MSSRHPGALRCTLATLVLAAVAAAPAPAAAATPAVGKESVLVKVAAGESAREVARRQGMVVVRDIPQIGWAELATPKNSKRRARTAAATISRLKTDRAVRKVDYQAVGEKFGFLFKPSDPVFRPEITYQDGTAVGWHFVKTNFLVAWDKTLGNSGTRVAVIDSEFDTDNPDLKEKLVVRYNAASGTAGYHTTDVKHKTGDGFHGSHVSGLAGGRTDNGIGTAGACFDCGIMAIKIGTNASNGAFVTAKFLGDLAEALVYAADNGASVVNMSVGGTRPHPPLQDALNYAHSKNVVLVAAAGNSQQSEPGAVNYPAAYNHVIAVAATDSKDAIAPFSTNGSFVDLAAPGVDVLSTTDANEQGAQTFEQQEPRAAIAIKSGTSMSSPIVAGLATLMRTVRPDLTPEEVEALLKSTAVDLGAGGADPLYGAGRIDAARAVDAAIAYRRPVPPTPPAPPTPPPPAGSGGPVGTFGPAKDTVGPAVGLKGRLKVTSRSMTFQLQCPAGEVACVGTVRVNAKRVKGRKGSKRTATLGNKTYSAKGGQSSKLRVSLSKKAKRTLRRWTRMQVTITVTATDSLGNEQVTRIRKTVKV